MTEPTPPDHSGGVALLEPPIALAGDLDAAPAPPPAPPSARRGRLARFVRGKEADPAWVRPALLTLLTLTAVLYLWDLGASGWANSFYSAAVQAGTKSWKAFFFGSSDSSNFITVDKPPAFLWPMEISARIFGLNSWSVLVPQALEGVATVGLVYLTVRRWFSAQAALLGGAVVALTPVAAMMFRYNNPDALLALLLTAALYATVRALEKGRTSWLVLAASLIGLGFITKMMQAFLILPAIVIVYLLAAPTGWWRRVWQVAVLGVATVVAAGWWVVAVALTPAADRPYVGGSQDNSLLNLIFGYNGLGRLDGSESGSVGGRAAAGGGSMWGPTGRPRLFNSEFGNMMSWLLPAALIMGAVLLVVTLRAKRTDRERAALLLWGGALVGTGLVISLAQGIIHPYYTVALAPMLGGLVGIGTMALWQRRHSWVGRAGLAAALAATTVWGYVLLGRTPTWFPAAAGARPGGRHRRRGRPAGAAPAAISAPKLAVVAVAALGFGAALAAPLFSTVATAATPLSGAIPSVTPSPAGGQAGPAAPVAVPGRVASAVRLRRRRQRCRPAEPPAVAASPAGGAARWGGFKAGWPARRRRRFAPGTGTGTDLGAGAGRHRRRGWGCGVLELEQFQSGPDQAAQGRRHSLHLGGGHRELQQRRRLPAGQ